MGSRGCVRFARAAAAVIAALAVVACPTQTQAPEVAIQADGVYATPNVTVGFTVTGGEPGYIYRATLSRGEGADYVELESGVVPEPVDGVGSVAWTGLEDGSYRLDLEVAARRGLGTYDLGFLTRAAHFLVDTADPEPPGATRESGDYEAPFEVFLSHPEIASPSGAAVSITYTLDGTAPTSVSTLYAVGVPIEVASELELRAIAVDAAGNESTVAAWSYAFPALAILVTSPDNALATSPSLLIDIYGAGSAEGATAVLEEDSDADVADVLAFSVDSSTHIVLGVDLPNAAGGDGAMVAGSATITVTNPNGHSDTVAFTLN